MANLIIFIIFMIVVIVCSSISLFNFNNIISLCHPLRIRPVVVLLHALLFPFICNIDYKLSLRNWSNNRTLSTSIIMATKINIIFGFTSTISSGRMGKHKGMLPGVDGGGGCSLL